MTKLFNGQWQYDEESVKKRPCLAVHFGIIASTWTIVETSLGMLFSRLLGTDAVLGTAMYLSLVSEQPRAAVMDVAVKEKLPIELKDEYDALIKALKTPRNARNTVLHGLWAISDIDKDCLILIDHRKMLRMFSFAHGHKMEPLSKELREYSDAIKDHATSAIEYREQDFIKIEQQILDAMKMIGEFHIKLSQSLA